MTEQSIKEKIGEIQTLIQKKAFTKADKAIKLLPDGVTKDELTRLNKEARKKAKAAKAAKAAGAPAVKAAPSVIPSSKVKVGSKMADPTVILDAYDSLLKILKQVENEQRLIGKPYRIYFVHRKRAEVMRQNFVKSMR